MRRLPARWFRTPILVERVDGESASGSGFDSPRRELGRRTGRSGLESTDASSEALSETLVLFLPSVAPIPLQSRLTLPVGDQNRVCYVRSARTVFMRDNLTVAYRAYEVE